MTRSNEEDALADRPVSRRQVLAFRAAAQSLDRRRPATDLLDVAAACGVQDTPPGNADVSLAARLDIDAPVVEEAVARKELVLTWSMRGAPHVFPPEDFAVFTLGARPAAGTVEALWGQPEHSLVEIERAMVAVIGSEVRPKGEVSGAVTASVPAELAPWCPGCKVHHPSESVFRAAPLLGRLVLTSTAPVLLATAKAWLGADATGDVDVLRTDLLRRYLHCYAPTTSGDFAQWAGIAKSDAKERWAAVAGALVPARGDTKGFVLEEDLQALDDPPTSTGVRLLPAEDAFLQARDRDVLFPDPANRKAAFPILGGPGVVLREALPVATWRGVAKGRRYEVTCDALRNAGRGGVGRDRGRGGAGGPRARSRLRGRHPDTMTDFSNLGRPASSAVGARSIPMAPLRSVLRARPERTRSHRLHPPCLPAATASRRRLPPPRPARHQPTRPSRSGRGFGPGTSERRWWHPTMG
ncbi:MAG: winged helix DNA-binding domain-containing protein [Actinomycetota bacterium]|nr:winged helix DNA-binding domain-containing protein [Actinomycetota bacterium]